MQSIMTRYRELLHQLRDAFPAPTSDPLHDGYMVISLLRALDKVDALKSQAPILGSPRELDFDAASQAKLPAHSRPLEQVVPELVRALEGMLIWAHPRSQVNVIAHPSIASIVGTLLPSMYNPNLCSEESGRGFSEAEVQAASMAANLIGYDPQQSGGVFTFGGTGTLLYGVKIGLEKALAGTFHAGLREPAVIVCSDRSHYACQSVAAWLGLGLDAVVKVRTSDDNAIDVKALQATLDELVSEKRRIAAIVATLGTTDAFGLDDLAAMHALRDWLVTEHKLDYTPHLHADAVIGWAWSVFRDYSFAANPLGFRGRTVRALAEATNAVQHLPLADSAGIDFHKTGFAPYVSSLFLLRNRAEFQLLARQRDTMPYIYHTGDYHPGMFTLETSRSACGVMSALASMLLLGQEGMQALIGHSVDMAEQLRELIVARPELTVLNEENVGPVTLFRAYPAGVNTFQVKDREWNDSSYRDTLRQHNELNRRIYQHVQQEALAGRGVALGFTDMYATSRDGEPINALKSYVLSPFVDAAQMDAVVQHVLAARDAVA
jgi:glutamate/tyrosine decarboxylase-like PLP-dependent enzyme